MKKLLILILLTISVNLVGQDLTSYSKDKLEEMKALAVTNEDYDLAGRITKEIAGRKSLVEYRAEFENALSVAVAAEDYQEAAAIKEKIKSLDKIEALDTKIKFAVESENFSAASKLKAQKTLLINELNGGQSAALKAVETVSTVETVTTTPAKSNYFRPVASTVAKTAPAPATSVEERVWHRSWMISPTFYGTELPAESFNQFKIQIEGKEIRPLAKVDGLFWSVNYYMSFMTYEMDFIGIVKNTSLAVPLGLGYGYETPQFMGYAAIALSTSMSTVKVGNADQELNVGVNGLLNFGTFYYFKKDSKAWGAMLEVNVGFKGGTSLSVGIAKRDVFKKK